MRWFEVSSHAEDQRLDNFLLGRLKGLPRSHLYRLIRKGEIRINKKRCKPDTRLQTGDMIRVAPLRLSEEKPLVPGRSLQRLLADAILYQDDTLMILNKPAGVPVHAGSGTAVGIIEALRHMAGPDGYRELVHRLDKDTSGCLLIACHGKALKSLQDNFRRQEVSKNYLALAHGQWPDSCREVNVALQRSQSGGDEAIVKVDPAGKPALTHFQRLATGTAVSLVRASPVTGRTHQIRVHCQYAGHPIVGDTRYTLDRYDAALRHVRQLQLHASGLAFRHPQTGDRVVFNAPLRSEMREVLIGQGIDPAAAEPATPATGTS